MSVDVIQGTHWKQMSDKIANCQSRLLNRENTTKVNLAVNCSFQFKRVVRIWAASVNEPRYHQAEIALNAGNRSNRNVPEKFLIRVCGLGDSFE
jgi:hypothetical protein